MLKIITCLILGHIKYEPAALRDVDMVWVEDTLGQKLVGINTCQRCGGVYSDLFEEKS